MNPGRTFGLGVVLLAAGRSSRMGRPKLVLPWGGTSVLGHLIGVWWQVPATQIGVVCAAGDAAIEAELERLGFPAANRMVNTDTARGMFSSIQCAAHWAGWDASLTHWALALGDQPHLRLTTLRAVVDLAKANPGKICQPASGGRARHPVVLPGREFRALAGTQCRTLKEFLEEKCTERMNVEVDDPGLELDIDSPEDYEAALKLRRWP